MKGKLERLLASIDGMLRHIDNEDLHFELKVARHHLQLALDEINGVAPAVEPEHTAVRAQVYSMGSMPSEPEEDDYEDD